MALVLRKGIALDWSKLELVAELQKVASDAELVRLADAVGSELRARAVKSDQLRKANALLKYELLGNTSYSRKKDTDDNG